MYQFRFIVFLLLAIIFLGGCSSNVVNTGYHSNYAGFKTGVYVEKCSVNGSLLNKNNYSAIHILSLSTAAISNQEGVSVDDCVQWLKTYIASAAATKGVPVSFGSDNTTQPLVMEIAITEMTPGSAFGRMMAGEFGVGHAWVQVEGRITDEELDEIVFSFSDRRRSSDHIGLSDIGGNAGPGMVRKMLEEIANDMVNEIKLKFRF